MALQDISDRLIGQLMAEIGERARNAIVTLGDADYERFEFQADASTTVL